MKNHLTLPGIDISGHSVLQVVWVTGVCEVGKSENEQPRGLGLR
jgi:hypothetical protein